ncbi:MAG TPA: tol-pal system protein YbgF [Phenylobacterium sp.]|nr:tol-pal system protein YbgF [Phenylobacterium sp.]
MSLRRLASPVLALMLMASAAPVFAQTPMDPLDARDAKRLDRMEQLMRELRSIVYQGRDSGKPVVVQPAETDYQLQELTRRVADLERSLTRLNGELETSNHDLALARRDVEALKVRNKAIEDRAQALEQAAQTAAAGAPPPPAELSGGAPAPSPGEAFSQARQLMLSGDYSGAEAGFQDYVARYGDSPRGPEARYWLGKTQMARTAYAEAAGSFIGAIRGWPQTGWAPDAVVELSRALIQLKKPSDACQTLGELSRRYPKASAAVQSRAAAARTQAKCAA